MSKQSLERIWSQAAKTAECWIWCGRTDIHDKYGRVSYHGRERNVHKVVYELVNGELPDGMDVHHTCGQTLCVRPDHLVAITHAAHQELSRKDFCRRGHALTPDNIQMASGDRLCRICKNERERGYRQRNWGKLEKLEAVVAV